MMAPWLVGRVVLFDDAEEFTVSTVEGFFFGDVRFHCRILRRRVRAAVRRFGGDATRASEQHFSASVGFLW